MLCICIIYHGTILKGYRGVGEPLKGGTDDTLPTRNTESRRRGPTAALSNLRSLLRSEASSPPHVRMLGIAGQSASAALVRPPYINRPRFRVGGIACAVDAPEPFGWEDGISCVEYEHAEGDVRLGVYTAYSMVESEPHIRPLCAADEEDGISCLFADEDTPAVPLEKATKVLDPDYVFVSERQAGGGQGLGNPHGEHGEQVYDLREVEISDGVTLIIRQGRDVERVL